MVHLRDWPMDESLHELRAPGRLFLTAGLRMRQVFILVLRGVRDNAWEQQFKRVFELRCLRDRSLSLNSFEMPFLVCLIVCFSISCARLAASTENFVAFDAASASSSYSQDVFAAKQALNAGSGYWCRCV